MAITLNKYSTILPDYAVLLIWLIPLALLIVWIVKEEKSKAFVQHFREIPIAYCVMGLLFIASATFTTSIVRGRVLAAKASATSKPSTTPQLANTLTPQPEQGRIIASSKLPNNTASPTPASHRKASPPASAIPEPTPAQPPVTQSGADNQQTTQTMNNSPGGMQAGRDIYAIGKLPAPNRILLPEDIEAAKSILSASKGSIEIITFPTRVPPNSEIDKFTDSLGYALSQSGWNVYRERNTYIGSYNGRTDMPYGSHGLGCSITEPNSDGAKAALLALEKLKLRCTGPSVISPMGEKNPFTLYITVGTRIVPEQ